jgi:SAM-dependent methyltransferase
VPSEPASYTDRRRADSFGSAADAYDSFRPRYPQPLIDALVHGQCMSVLDVGAGTGIASIQLAEAGAQVLAVEPDARMAAVARAKGVHLEESTFEDWQPEGRTFDLVVFAQSFHWVKPCAALEKVSQILAAGGRLALIWNRIVPVSPSQLDLDTIYADYLDTSDKPEPEPRANAVFEMIRQAGFSVERQLFPQRIHYSADAWLNMVFTYSNHLTLEPRDRIELRERLAARIDGAEVQAENNALAIYCTPNR